MITTGESTGARGLADDGSPVVRIETYDGNYDLSWLTPLEEIRSAGDGTGACEIIRADGTVERIEVGQSFEVHPKPERPQARIV